MLWRTGFNIIKKNATTDENTTHSILCSIKHKETEFLWLPLYINIEEGIYIFIQAKALFDVAIE
mgnify:CR=1 FL=1